MKAKVIIPFGPPNTGKGTRISEVIQQWGDKYESLSVSNMLRVEVKNQTDLGKEAKSYMEEGTLVPDQLIIAMFLKRIQHSQKNLFFDGFPRTVGQAKAMLEAGIIPNIVILLKVDEEVMLQRARDRLVCPACGESYTKTSSFKRPKAEGICDKCGAELQRRKDDADEEVVKKRLKVYDEETRPVLEFLESAGVNICTIDNSSDDAGEKFKELIQS